MTRTGRTSDKSRRRSSAIGSWRRRSAAAPSCGGVSAATSRESARNQATTAAATASRCATMIGTGRPTYATYEACAVTVQANWDQRAGRPRPATGTSTSTRSTVCLDAINAHRLQRPGDFLHHARQVRPANGLPRRRRRRRPGLTALADVERRAPSAPSVSAKVGNEVAMSAVGTMVSSPRREPQDRRPPWRCGDRARGRRRRPRAAAAEARRRRGRPGAPRRATPARPSSRASAAMRSDSLTRSSARSANVVSPSARRGRDGQRRDLVDGAQRQLAGDARAAQRAARARARGRPARPSPRRSARCQVGAHRAQRVERARRASG